MNQQVINAAHLNQSGASCLAANDLEQAQRYFQLALESVTHAGHDIAENDSVPAPPKCDASQSLQMSKQPISKTNSHESEGFIYSKPFFFNPAATLTEEDIAPYGGVILFNLALTYHERSRVVGESALRVAMKLYEKCLSLLKHARTFDCSNVIIAALNNQARIFEEVADYKRASYRFRLLAEFLNEDDVRTDTMEKADLQDIFLNIFFFKFPTCAAMA